MLSTTVVLSGLKKTTGVGNSVSTTFLSIFMKILQIVTKMKITGLTSTDKLKSSLRHRHNAACVTRLNVQVLVFETKMN